MSTITPEESKSLRDAVVGLTEAVHELQRMMREDYPKREELEEKFVTKYGIKKRRLQYFVITFVAIVASYFISMGTVSYCFLDGSEDHSVLIPKTFCKIVPGYSGAVESNKQLITTFEGIVKTTQSNDARLDKIENKLNK